MRRNARTRGLIVIGMVGIVLLSACGESTTIAIPTPAPVPTATATAPAVPSPTTVPTVVPTTVPTIVPTIVSATRPAATIVPNETFGRDCGTVQMRGPETINGPAAQQAVDCFWQAYQRQCSAVGTVVLRITQMGVDTFTTRDFTFSSPGGVCTVQESVESRVVGRATTATYTCAGLMRDPSGALHFQACGKDGDIIVPPPKA